MIVDPAVWRLRVSCDVRRISGTDQFDIHWFHKNNQNETIDLGQAEVLGIDPNREIVLFGTQWYNKPFNESMLGEYWCQVIVTSTQPNIYLGKSDILVIRDPENYDTGLQRCQRIISVPTSKCADGIVTLQMSEAFTSSSSSSSSSFSFPSITCSNSQTNIKTYSSIQIDTPSNSLSKSDDSGLISFHIVIIIVTLIMMILGILSIITCLVIICIKKNKKPEDTSYYGESLIML